MSDEIFDPEIHATDKDGNPSLNKDGSFRKKRKDAGAKATTTRPRTKAAAGPGAAKEKYRKAVSDFLAIPTTVLTMTDPVMGYAAAEVSPMWAEGLADLAVERPQFAAALEKVGGLGVVGGLLGLGVMTAVQFGHLAGKVPAHVVQMMGGKTREQIQEILAQRGEHLAAQRGQSPEHARAEAPAGPVMAHV